MQRLVTWLSTVIAIGVYVGIYGFFCWTIDTSLHLTGDAAVAPFLVLGFVAAMLHEGRERTRARAYSEGRRHGAEWGPQPVMPSVGGGLEEERWHQRREEEKDA
jgi:hypothetical protein